MWVVSVVIVEPTQLQTLALFTWCEKVAYKLNIVYKLRTYANLTLVQTYTSSTLVKA